MTTTDRVAPPVAEPPRRGRARRRRARGGPRWLDFAIAATALVVSVASLLVARHQAQVMDRQLAAQVWPLVEYETSNLGDDGRPQVSLDLINAGVGPTLVRSVRLTYRGQPVRSWGELLRACCRAAIDTTHPLRTVTNDIAGRVLTAGKTVHFFILPPDTAQRALFLALDRERMRTAARVCYCSVLDECWVRVMTADGGETDPAAVPSCADERRQPQYR